MTIWVQIGRVIKIQYFKNRSFMYFIYAPFMNPVPYSQFTNISKDIGRKNIRNHFLAADREVISGIASI